MAAMYGLWHGPDGLTNIASRVNHLTQILHDNLSAQGFEVITPKDRMFDTLAL